MSTPPNSTASASAKPSSLLSQQCVVAQPGSDGMCYQGRVGLFATIVDVALLQQKLNPYVLITLRFSK